jgi:hypothetical protein
MYSYMAISTNIGICDIYLGIGVPHQHMCHCIGIRDSILGHDINAMSSHMPRGPFICILLT